MRTVNTSIIGNLTRDPVVKDVGKSKVCNFSVAVSTCEKDSSGNYMTNFYEVEWFGAPSLMDRFVQDAKKGTPVWVTGPSWMYSYFSKRTNSTAYGLKIRASDVTLVGRSAARTAANAAASSGDDFDVADL